MTTDGDLYLGIDGGGSSCRALLCNGAGEPLGSGQSGPANIASNYQGAVTHIIECSERAMADAGQSGNNLSQVPVVMGLAGFNSVDDPFHILKDLPFKKVDITTDAIIGMEGALGEDDGHVAIIGTGTVYLSRTSGDIRSIGGWGFNVSDQGSGAWLGRRLLEETLLAYDHVRQGSPVTQMVMTKFNENPQSVAAFGQNALPSEFAAFAPALFEAAGRGDPVALEIRDEGLAAIEKVLSAQAGNTTDNLCLIGGLAVKYSDLLGENFQAQLRAPLGDAATGAAKRAIRVFSDGKRTPSL